MTHALVDALWAARTEGTTVAPREIELDEARATLAQLTARAVEGGDEVVGWKIARLPDPDGHDVVFAGPVFATSIGPAARALVSPRFEVEYVACLDTLEPADVTWRLGIEVVDNHAPDWTLDPAWALADWAVHAGAVLGQACAPPVVGQTHLLELTVGAMRRQVDGTWRTGVDRMFEVLAHDCPALLRPWQAGDRVWSGSLLAPAPLPIGAEVVARVGDVGEVRLGATSFWGPTGVAASGR